MSLDTYIRAMPKVDLHVHLAEAIPPATLLELARRNGVALPAGTWKDSSAGSPMDTSKTSCSCTGHAPIAS